MQNTKQVKKDSFDILRLSLYIQFQVITIDMDWLYHLFGVWSTRPIVLSAIFMVGFVSRRSELKENY